MRTRHQRAAAPGASRFGEPIRLDRGLGGNAGGTRADDGQTADRVCDLALERLARITVPPELLQLGLRDYAEPAMRKSFTPLSAILLDHVVAMGLPGNPIEVALSAQLRVLALACVVRDHFLEEWVRRGDPNGIVLFHADLFTAAATEPLIFFPPDGIGFDPESLRRRVLLVGAAEGSA